MKSSRSFNLSLVGRGREVALVLVVLTLPFFLGAWKIIMGRSINPSYVEHIRDGKTQKHEILTLFGDPDEIEHTPEAVVYVYKTFRNKETLPKRERQVKSAVQDSPYYREDWLEQKEARERKAARNKELASRLIIRFDREGTTVQSHDFKQF
jgi:outer membrane protein assembly factor BamE (lipoprotein component of BamABCDE complex)